MRLPDVEHAIVPSGKIIDYLLSQTHPEGHDKAVFFMAFGFSVVAWEQLASALLKHAALNDVVKVVENRFGVRYVVEGALDTPDQRNPSVRSIWFIERGEESPRLVTAYPL